MALIKEADVDFKKGLNIFTGETGAGKSLLLGSVSLALGAKLSGDVIRHGEDFAYVELVFSVENEESKKAIENAGYETDEDVLVISRKISGNKSIFRINGEAASASVIRLIAGSLLDIHGQHDHQSLLYGDKQLSILDEYGGKEIKDIIASVSEKYFLFADCKKRMLKFSLNEEERLREISLLEYEIEEIESAQLREGEEEELESLYRKMSNSKSIAVSLNQVHSLTGYDGGAADLIGNAVKEINSILQYDETLQDLAASLSDVDCLLSDINRSAAAYLEDFTFSDAEFASCGERLDKIHHLQSKYGHSIKDVLSYADKQSERLEFLNNYAKELENAKGELKKAEDDLKFESSRLTDMRKNHAKKLEKEIINELKDLNFNNVEFEIRFFEKQSYTKNGNDNVEYMISTNIGEPPHPLSKVASGGELSRIMLAIKTILSKNDPVETLIFDEIDTGISGKTAVKVAKKLMAISEHHQVLCITHLAQIAAASDAHYAIEKYEDGKETFTSIKKLNEDESLEELARLLGGISITDTVRQNARELKMLTKQK